MSEPNIQVIKAIPDMDVMEQLMRETEIQLHEAGWDQRFQYMTIVREPNGGGVGVISMILPDQLYRDPGMYFPKLVHWLKLCADNTPGENFLTREEATEMVENMVRGKDYFYGFALFGEGWSVRHDLGDDATYEDVVREARNHPRPSQDPRRKEERFGFGCTIDGRLVNISRIRGQFPQFRDLTGDDDGYQAAGPMADSLRLLTTVCQDLLS